MSTDFVFPVYDDQELVLRLIADLRQLYPDANLICVSDGAIEDQEFAEQCDRASVNLIQTSQRLKLPEFGGLWLERLLSYALEHSQAETIIRTEGDTKFWRTFSNIPDADIAGNLSFRYGFRFARGGCVALKRSAIAQILNSEFLRDSEYCNNPKYSYQRYGKFRYADEEIDNSPILLSDLVLGSVADRLELSIEQWNEVNIQFRGAAAPIHNYAATHPHR